MPNVLQDIIRSLSVTNSSSGLIPLPGASAPEGSVPEEAAEQPRGPAPSLLQTVSLCYRLRAACL